MVGRSQRPEDPADAERVGDRLAKPEARRDLEVDQRGPVAPDLDHVEHVVGPLERRAPIEVRADRRRGATLAGDARRHRLGGREPIRVDVVERDLGLAELGVLEDVPEQVLREDDAAGADERDPPAAHSLVDPSVRPLMNCLCNSANTRIDGIATSTAAAAMRLLFEK